MNAGRDLWTRNARKVLARHGYSGDALEARLEQLMRIDIKKEYPRFYEILTTPFKEIQRRAEMIGYLTHAATATLAMMDFSPEQKSNAEKAIQEAAMIVVPIEPTPWISFTETNLVLRWGAGNEEVILYFSGEGKYASSTKSGPDHNYTVSYSEWNVSDGIPDVISAKISQIAISLYKAKPEKS
jgi:hypothetical protein